MSELRELGRKGLPALTELKTLLGQGPFSELNHPNNDDNTLIQATNDFEACQSFLSRFSSQATIRTYRREIERLLLWCAYHGISFGQFSKETVDTYDAFLQNPSPRQLWCYQSNRATRIKRHSANWRPFVKGLSGKTLLQHLKIISALFEYLVSACYLRKNPFALRLTDKFVQDKAQIDMIDRIPSQEEWRMILKALDGWEAPKEKVRLRFVISVLFYTGMRVSELANLTWSAFHHTQSGWSIYLIGKGGKPREIVVEDLLTDIMDYRQSLGLSLLPLPGDCSPVVMTLDGKKGIGDRQIFNLVKSLAKHAANLASDDNALQLRLKKFSPHWIRHLCPTLLAKAGVDTRTIQRHLGHSSSRTTEIYVHLLNNDKREAVRKLNMEQY